MTEYEFETRRTHAVDDPDERGALVSPVYNSVTFGYDSPTRDAPNGLIADLDGAIEAVLG
jgi:O-acetylhomoserine/O-acetylserine sulfhydrylase-like pyridoxal-dependent enzyme